MQTAPDTPAIVKNPPRRRAYRPEKRLPRLLRNGSPSLRIDPEGLLYIKVKVEDCEEIIERSILKDEIVERLVYQDQSLKSSIPDRRTFPFYIKADARCPGILRTYQRGIRQGIHSRRRLFRRGKGAFDMTPQQIVDEIPDSSPAGQRRRRRFPPPAGNGRRCSVSLKKSKARCLQW